MLEVKTFSFNPFMENTMVLFDETKECVIVDPGCYEDHEKNELKAFIDDTGLQVKKLINTHCHIDHVLGNAFVKDTYKVPLITHKIEEQQLKSVESYASVYGFPVYESSTVDEYFGEGDKVEFGNTQLDIIFVPGHSPGHVALLKLDEKMCFSGDVLFKDSIGRADLPGGDYDTLINSIQQQLFKLDDDIIVFPGHGPTTTIGYEKAHNPFCAIG